MPFRDIALSLTMMVLIPMGVRWPWIGIMVWSWIGYMNPHRLVWGFARDLPWAMLVAISTFAGILLAKDEEKRPIPWTPVTVLLAALWFWYLFTTIFSWYPSEAWPQLEKVSKILLFTFLTLKFFQNRYRLHALFLLLALSLGFYGLKGGVWSVFVSGGVHMVMGPEATFLEGNTEVGLAMVMTLPFLHYLAGLETRRWLRLLMRVTFACTIVATIFTYSRGAMIGLPVVLLMLFAGSRRRIVGIAAMVVLYFFVMNFAPREWFEKMETIQTYEEDESARGRLTSWRVATLVALDSPITGGGFWVLPHKAIFEHYAPGYPFRHSAHSIYFAVLGDHGFAGLILFVALILSCFASLIALRVRLHKVPGAETLVVYSKMVEASLAAYAISGTFLTMAYFDLFYHLVSFVILLQVIAVREGWPEPRRYAARPPRRHAPPDRHGPAGGEVPARGQGRAAAPRVELPYGRGPVR
jgi:probable O-glycosylation ligase (exosortase A-associated)